MALSLKERITKALIDSKLVAEDALTKALAVQKEKGGSLSDILLSLGLVTKENLIVLLSQEFGIPPINLSRYKIDASIIKAIPRKLVRQYGIVPISRMGDTLTIAVSDPLNILAVDDLHALTGHKINMVLASDKDIQEAIGQYYSENTYVALEKIVEDMKEDAEIKMVEDGEQSVSGETISTAQDAPVVKLTNMILSEAITARASDILVEPLDKELRIRFRIDGVLHDVKRPPKSLLSAIVSRVKVMADLDIAERRLPQDGRFKIRLHGRAIDFRVSILPSSRGEKAALRILDKSQAMLDLGKLGFDARSLDEITKASEHPHGMIIMAGPTGCGKTTTLYSILAGLNVPEDNVVTVEDPVEYVVEGLNQVTSRPDIGLTFATALRSILRQDPDTIMIGEIRDLDTVDIAIKAALTGHLVLSTIHTTTATGSIIRLVNMGVEPFLLTSSLILVGAQRLVRKICPNCKEPHDVSDELISRYGIPVAKGSKPLFYRGKGCESCFKTGYRGRVGLIEVLTLTPKIKALILKGAQEHEMREVARSEGMTTLRENGLLCVKQGITTLDEVLRVSVGEQDIPA